MNYAYLRIRGLTPNPTTYNDFLAGVFFKVEYVLINTSFATKKVHSFLKLRISFVIYSYTQDLLLNKENRLAC